MVMSINGIISLSIYYYFLSNEVAQRLACGLSSTNREVSGSSLTVTGRASLTLY